MASFRCSHDQCNGIDRAQIYTYFSIMPPSSLSSASVTSHPSFWFLITLTLQNSFIHSIPLVTDSSLIAVAMVVNP